ncbi:MBL fold metallo-hydrolase [Marinibacterium sp. SX1]|uniref:MBL fold metallo-hydrolase n=1 Tax=Marinibacterium sp. SX1 TaxID=3388424 RepID=UPI003D1685C4
MTLTRRTALLGGAALPMAAATAARAAEHESAPAMPPMPHARGFQLGDFAVTTLLDGSLPRDGVKDIFGVNVDDTTFRDVSAANFIPADMAQFYFTPTLVDTGAELVLFDTGLGQGGITRALAEAGRTPDEIDVVVLTHMHGDHIGGLMTDGAPTFANARYVTGRAEYDGWKALPDSGPAKQMATHVDPLADKMTFIEDGDSPVSGITAMAAFGHTPGHMTYMLESAGQQLVLTADLANHYVWPFQDPDWHTSFDSDKDAASASRRRILAMLATERVPMIGYHMPFPAAGFVETRGEGFRFVPVGYQLMG